MTSLGRLRPRSRTMFARTMSRGGDVCRRARACSLSRSAAALARRWCCEWTGVGALALVVGTAATGGTVLLGDGVAAPTAAPAGPPRSIEVVSLANSGRGSFRDALARGGEGSYRIVFRVGGVVRLERQLVVRRGMSVTIDGATAPPPGITLEGYGLAILDSVDVVIRDIRVRRPAGDAIKVKGSRNVVIDHCSVSDAGDENVSVTGGSRAVTVSWSVIGQTPEVSAAAERKGLLIASFHAEQVSHVSVHHNVFVNNAQRSPQVSTAGLFDIRNNTILNWTSYGVRIRNGAWGNIVGNVFRSAHNPQHALVITPDAGLVYVGRNLGPKGMDVNRSGTADQPFPMPGVVADDAMRAEQAVLDGAGARPRDAVDTRLLSQGRP